MKNLFATLTLLVLFTTSCSSFQFPWVYRLTIQQGNIVSQEMIDKDHYEEDDFKKVKEIKRDPKITTDKYEEALTYLDSAYSAKATKFAKELKEGTENFGEIERRRDSVRTRVKEANEHIEAQKEKSEAKRRENDKEEAKIPGGGAKKAEDKQFKQPSGALPDRISSDYTPHQARDLASNMQLYIKGCTNLERLNLDEQRTLCRKFVCPTLWLQVIFLSANGL